MNVLALIPYLAPAALLGVAAVARTQPGKNPRRVLAASNAGMIFAILVAAASAAVLAITGPMTSPVLGVGEAGLSARLDALSVVMFAMVTVVGWVVTRFSRNYLDGEERHGAFLGGLALTVAMVLLLVSAGNLVQLAAAWVGTSLALHQLLVFYRERPGAIVAARKKFVVARLGDVCLFSAGALLVFAFGTVEIAGLLATARDAAAAGTFPVAAQAAAVLIVLAAALKSAMWPSHGWVLEVMETPTPVSALLHAGLINAGTFLVVRLGDVVLAFAPATWLLMVVGGFTSLLASTAMVTQNNVKVSLAWSSAAHMGFMLMLCGLGAHTVAILHLIGHSFYKAHAFLSSGSVVEYVGHVGRQKGDPRPSLGRVLLALTGSFAIFVGMGLAFGAPLAERPMHMAVGAILVMAIAHLLVVGLGEKLNGFVVARTAVLAAGVALAFYTLEALAMVLLGSTVAPTPDVDGATLAVIGLVVAAYAFTVVTQTLRPALLRSAAYRTAYVHVRNGLYANAWFDRLVGAYRQ